jgi:trk system potassium uptake protein TrkH
VLTFIALKFSGMDTFESLNHAMTTISSGGFSTKNASIGHFQNPALEWVIIVTMLASAISFSLYYRLFTGKVVSVAQNSELRAYFFIVAATSLVVWYINRGNDDPSFRTAMFQVVSMTTTGYNTTDYTKWAPASQFMLLTVMFIGGCAGSTAGGFKMVRVVVLFKQAINELRLMVHPRGVFMLRLNGISINKKLVYTVFGFFFLYVFSIAIVSAVAATAGMDLLTSVSTGLAMVSNLGAGLGGVGPSGSFATYPDYVKWVLGIAMLAGRLELYGFFVLLMPFFWRR